MHEKFFEILTTEHDKVRDLMQRIIDTPDRNRTKREELFYELKQNLIPHMKGEENSLYQAMERDKRTHMLALIVQEEHRAARQVLHLLDEIGPDEERWTARMHVLQHILLNHIEGEERFLFKKAEEIFSHEQLQEIFNNYQQVEQKVLAKI